MAGAGVAVEVVPDVLLVARPVGGVAAGVDGAGGSPCCCCCIKLANGLTGCWADTPELLPIIPKAKTTGTGRKQGEENKEVMKKERVF